MKCGDRVYHVANPNIVGTVITPDYAINLVDFMPTIGVMFSEPVTFSLNLKGEKSKYWICSHNLLHPTADLAAKNNVPELKDPEIYMKFIEHKFQK